MAIADVTAKALATTLQIRMEEGYIDLINNDVDDFASVEAMADATGAASREIRYALKGSRPVDNAQLVNPGAVEPAFIEGESSDIVEKTAKPKEINVACQFDQAVFARALADPSLVYAGVMDLTIFDQQVNSKEVVLRDYYGDATGARGTIATDNGTVASNAITYKLYNVSTKPGCPYWIEEGMKLMLVANDGTAVQPAVTSGTSAYIKVTSVDQLSSVKTITAQVYNAAGTLLTLDNTAAQTSQGTALDCILYSYGDLAQGGLIDRTGITDWGYLLHMTGLQALSANDGRTIDGTVRSGRYAGTVLDKGDNTPLHFTDFANLLGQLVRKNGADKYDYPMAKCSEEVWNHLINLDEGNKFLRPMENGRGAVDYYYVRKGQKIKFDSVRFCPDYDVWFEPKLKATMAGPDASNRAPILFKFTGFDYIQTPDSSSPFEWKVKGGQRLKVVEAHLQTFGQFVSQQASAIGRIKGGTIA